MVNDKSPVHPHIYVQDQECGYIVCEKHECSQHNNMFLDLIYTARLHMHNMSQKWISTNIVT